MKYKLINKTFRITNTIMLYKSMYDDRYTYTFEFNKTRILYNKNSSTYTFVYKNLFINNYFFTSCSIYIYVTKLNSIKYI